MVRVVVGDEGQVEGFVDSLFQSRLQVQVLYFLPFVRWFCRIGVLILILLLQFFDPMTLPSCRAVLGFQSQHSQGCVNVVTLDEMTNMCWVLNLERLGGLDI